MQIKLVIFDVNQTMFSLNEIEKRFEKNKLEKSLVNLWFYSVLKEGFSYSLSGKFIDFRTIGINELEKIFLQNSLNSNKQDICRIIDGFKCLKIHSDIRQSLEILKKKKIKVVTLTNGSQSNTRLLLKRNKIDKLVDDCFSIEQVKKWKPHKKVYLYVCKSLKISPKNSLMIAAHGWDINGAKLTGLKTGYIKRYEKILSNFYLKPDLTGKDSFDIIQKMFK
jgi:2-haloacid dehalogenase